MQRRARQHWQRGAPLALACLAWAALAAAPAAAERRTASELERDLGSGVEVSVQEETGRVGFIATAPGEPISRPTGYGPGAVPRRVASAFLGTIEPELGIRDADTELRVTAASRDEDDRASVRYAQLHDGVPVIGGELIVNLDADRNVLSLSGETEPRPGLETDPRVSAAEADDSAIATVAREHGADPATLDAGEGELSIYDSRLLGGPGLGVPELVWRFEVTSSERLDIRHLVLVDAERGAVLVSFNQVHAALDRRICDAGNATVQVPCLAPVRTEGGGAVADSGASTVAGDANAAYEFAGDTYAFYEAEHGRDSVDGAGLKLISTVDYCAPSPTVTCPGPMPNAFWNGSQMAYGDGFAGADDVVGHELTHGVTEFSSSLYYYYQSGAISESLSDVWGEFIDLGNGAGSDAPGDRWMLGEDLPGGATRSLADPTVAPFFDPDRMTSVRYDADTDEGDNGGVHHNSGIGNKAAYLLADGGTFNGRTVSPLGISKTADILYEAQTRLITSAADYEDLDSALGQACSNLVGSGGITSADCTEVGDATDAVEMDANPPVAPTTQALTCTTGGESPADAFFDDFEDTASGNYRTQVQSGGNVWSYPPSAIYATSGTNNLDGFDAAGANDSSLAMRLDVAVPIGGYVHFAHAYGFDDDPGGAYDGGVVEYSTTGGSSWKDLGPKWAFGGYNGAIAPGNGVPGGMDGRAAFVRESNGYGASRADVDSLAGKELRLRFRIGTDAKPGVSDQGWFIDDLRIYGCAPETTITKKVKRPAGRAAAVIATSDRTPTLKFTSSSANPQGFECRVDKKKFKSCRSGKPLAKLGNGKHKFRVRALGSRLTPDPTPAKTSFKVSTTACKKAKKAVKKAKKAVKKAKKQGSKQKLKKAKKKLKKKKRKKKKKC